MHNLGDDSELDQMSRDAAGKYTAPGAPDWQRMEMELDKVLPVEKKRRVLYWWLLPVLLAGGTIYWLLEKNNDITGSETSIATVTATDKASAPVTSATAGNTAPIPEQNPAPVPAGSVTQNGGQKNVSTATTKLKIPATAIQSPKENSIQRMNPAKAVSQQPNPVDNAPWQEQVSIPSSEQPAAAVAAVNAGPGNNNAVAEQPVPEKNTTADIEAFPIVVDKKNPASYRYGKGWSLAAIAGIDKSTVKFSYGDKPGMNTGIIGGYHFNDKLSLHAGAIYTQKNYTMAGQDFNAPKGSWASYYKLDEVEGYCRMWEIPLLARYAFTQHGRSNYFVSTGLSSYFMTSEQYTYYYHSQGQPASRSATYGGGDSHILSILHLSGGFESTLSKNLRLQIEPYAKIPLAGVGLGSIQLSSFGVNLGLQLRQPSKN